MRVDSFRFLPRSPGLGVGRVEPLTPGDSGAGAQLPGECLQARDGLLDLPGARWAERGGKRRVHRRAGRVPEGLRGVHDDPLLPA